MPLSRRLLAQVMTAAYAAQDATVRLTYLPWQRGYNETLSGFNVGTFPYAKNAEQVERSMRASGFQYKPLMLDVDYAVDDYLMVPRVHPDSIGVIARFKAGLALVRKSGAYKKIMVSFVVPTVSEFHAPP